MTRVKHRDQCWNLLTAQEMLAINRRNNTDDGDSSIYLGSRGFLILLNCLMFIERTGLFVFCSFSCSG